MTTFKTYKTERAKCPSCGENRDRATFAYHWPDPRPATKPRAGDIGVCWNCASVNIYTDDSGNLRKPTANERKILGKDPRLIKMVLDIIDLKL